MGNEKVMAALLSTVLLMTALTGFAACFDPADVAKSNSSVAPKIDNTKQATIWLSSPSDPSAPAMFHCTGAILSRQHVVTASACVDSLTENDLLVSASKDRLSELAVFSSVHNITSNVEYDLAVLRVDDTFFPASSVVDLVDEERYIASGDKCIASGWFSGIDLWMYEGVLYLINEDCSEIYSKLSTPLDNIHVCTIPELGNATCTVGLGWTLICDNQLTGVFTWTHYSCEQPSVYASVVAADAWLKTFKSSSSVHRCSYLLILSIAFMWISLYF